MMHQESIYNIIQRNPQISPKKPIYRSKYPHDIPPTGSTFAIHTTSKPGVSNLSGEFNFPLEAHTPKGRSQSLGYAKGDRKSLPSTFQRKATGIMGSNELPPIRNFSYDCHHCKDRVPKANERPIYGKKSGRDFIVANALDAILSTAKQPPKTTDWTRKKDYGKTPQYLNLIKQTLSNEYKMIQTLRQQRQQKKKFLSAEETDQLREGLKRKWDEINRDYQKMCHIKLYDTVGLRRKKDSYQSQLHQIQEDIKKLNKGYILIEN